MPEWKGKNRLSKDRLRAFLGDMDKIAGYRWSMESDRLVVDDEPEGQESSAVTPASVEQQADQRADRASFWRWGSVDESEKCSARPDQSR
jgi:hypothetical protein